MNREVIGGNNPPSMTETAGETMRDISAWLSEHPIIATEEDARESKVFLDRGKLALKDMDDERDGKVRPLNEQVKEINASYRPAKDQLAKVLESLTERLSNFIRDEKRKREEAAREAAKLAQEAEDRAREAERIERESIESANNGELGVDLAAHTVEADNTFREFERATRAAALAEKETKVRIGGGFSRAVGLRNKENLHVKDGFAALKVMGVTPDIAESILKSARAFRKITGDLPDGVEATYTEEI